MWFLITNSKPALLGKPLEEPSKSILEWRLLQLDILSLDFWVLQREIYIFYSNVIQVKHFTYRQRWQWKGREMFTNIWLKNISCIRNQQSNNTIDFVALKEGERPKFQISVPIFPSSLDDVQSVYYSLLTVEE
jgi:hypothetical protein